MERIKDSLNQVKRALYGIPAPTLYKSNPDSVKLRAFFQANPVQNFTPMDNALARSKNGTIVSVVNTNMCVFNESGQLLFTRNFRQLAADPALNGRYFDPRVVYDEASDRFFMMILHGIQAAESRVLFFVSATNDPAGSWNFFAFNGDPFSEGNMSDYPHLSVGPGQVWITVNQFRENSGEFKKSLVYVIDKSALLQNQQAQLSIYSELKTLMDFYPSSLVPAASMDGNPYPGMFFVSSRSVGGEHIHLFYLDASGSGYRYAMKVNPYELPADALQQGTGNTLDAGDCRVTGAYLKNNLLHFCLTARGNGLRSAIFYGRGDITNGRCAGKKIEGVEDLAYAYPAPFSGDLFNRASLIGLVYSSEKLYPSTGFIYVDDQMKRWPLQTVWAGQNPRPADAGEQARWGDYTGAVFVPGGTEPTVWVAAAGTGPNGEWKNTIARIQGDPDSARILVMERKVEVYPNPNYGRLVVEIGLLQSAPVSVELYDSKGSRVVVLLEEVLSRGANRLVFEPVGLSSGIYFLQVRSEKELFRSEKLVVF